MGAFDIELAALGYSTRSRSRPSNKKKKMSTFYVSWAGDRYGGSTGKHFDNRDEAMECYRQRLEEGKRPNAWFKMNEDGERPT